MEGFGKDQIKPEGGSEERGPGSHSGHESLPQERVIPGTASATEGYGPEGGTRDGEALKGVEVDPEEAEDVEQAREAAEE